jgi:hypothetical protein
MGLDIAFGDSFKCGVENHSAGEREIERDLTRACREVRKVVGLYVRRTNKGGPCQDGFPLPDDKMIDGKRGISSLSWHVHTRVNSVEDTFFFPVNLSFFHLIDPPQSRQHFPTRSAPV